jgi:parallel beta-helix repeat protein
VVFCFVLSGLLVFPVVSGLRVTPVQGAVVVPLQGLPVRNLNTTLSYATVQEAIDAPETLAGHVISVPRGTYRERVSVTKSLSIVGEDRASTVINGLGGTVFHVLSRNVQIRDLTVQNGTSGIWVDDSDGAVIVNNLVSGGSYGIRLYNSSDARVVGNEVRGFTFFGIEIDQSGNSFLRNNKMVSNKYNFGVEGNGLADFLNDIDESNTVNGKPVRYLINQHGLIVNSSNFGDAGFIGFVNSTNIAVEDLELRNNKQGILFASVANSSIMSVNAVDNWNGVYVAHSKNVTVSWSTSNYNFDYGIKFFNSSRSTATDNNVDNNGWAGIGLFKSPSSILDRNEANFNSYNLHLVYSNNSVITRNNASGLDPRKSGSTSIAVYYSHNNRIYHNSFSTVLFYVESRNGSRFTPSNKWDNGYEGNYWLYYGGSDADHDGIGDAKYNVGDNNVDNFPLMGRYWDYFVLWKVRLHSVSVISSSGVSRFEFDSKNLTITLMVSGRNGTLGFSRIAIQNSLIQDVGSGSVKFNINGLQVSLVRNWSDGGYHYWYFTYFHTEVPPVEDAGFWPLVYAFGISALLLSVGLVAFAFLRRRRHVLK